MLAEAIKAVQKIYAATSPIAPLPDYHPLVLLKRKRENDNLYFWNALHI